MVPPSWFLFQLRIIIALDLRLQLVCDMYIV